MKNLIQLIRESISRKLLEVYAPTEVNVDNFDEMSQKLTGVVADDENLKNGLKFTRENIKDYHTDEFTKEMVDKFFVSLNRYIQQYRPTFFNQFDKGYTGRKVMGRNYEQVRDMDIKDIAKLVREELKIKFPKWKFSIKISRFAGGRALDIRVLGVPYNPFGEEAQKQIETEEYVNKRSVGFFIREYKNDFREIEKAVEQYRMTDSDGMIDYFHTNFYGRVETDTESLINQYYPNSPSALRSKAFDDNWKAQQKKRSEEIAIGKGKYKKGTEIVYTWNLPAKSIPIGDYKGVVIKSPSGRGASDSYRIKFYVDKKFDENRNVVPRETPAVYEVSLSKKEFEEGDKVKIVSAK